MGEAKTSQETGACTLSVPTLSIAMETARVRSFLVLTFTLLTLSLTSCFLAGNKEINLLVVRTDTGGSEVTVTYRMPPPEDGTVYVLWVLNPDLGRTTRVGVLEPTSTLRAVKTRVDYWATGAVISIESSPNVTGMSGDSVLESGQTRPGTVTPGKPSQ